MTLDKALTGNPDLRKEYESDPDTRKMIDSARKLEGLTRGEGVHASAVIICRDAVADYVPVKLDTKGGVIITQYDGHMTADMGLLKMDFLGLRTLTVISKALRNIKDNYGIDLDLEKTNWKTDEGVFKLMETGGTNGVFQIESPGMRALLKRMKPDTYDDVVAVIALYRPGPLGAGMVDDFVDRKQGRKKIVYYDERLKDILESTYGTIVYQEQVMRISIVMSGFTLGESDKVRKAVAKKKIALMKEVEQKWDDGNVETMENHWLNGAVRNGYERATAQKIWDDVLAFAEYAFNKSHSAAYGILTMQTAWLKAHYPNEYMASVLSSYTGKTDKIVHYVNACKQDGINVLPPDINESRSDFTAVENGVRFGLAGLKGVGEKVVEIIIAEREENGPFTDLYDFVFRVPADACNKRVVEALVKGGAFDSTGYTRRQLWALLHEGSLLERDSSAVRTRKMARLPCSICSPRSKTGQTTPTWRTRYPPADGVEWDRLQKLEFEKEVVGIYVSDHPLSPYTELLKANSHAPLSEVDDEDLFHDTYTYDFAGMVAGIQVKTTKSGNNMAIMQLEDLESSIECVLWSKTWEKYRDLLQNEGGVGNPIVHLHGKFERSDRGVQVIVKDINPLSLEGQGSRRGPSALTIRVRSDKFSNSVMSQLSSIFDNYPGVQPVTRVHRAGGWAQVPRRIAGQRQLRLAGAHHARWRARGSQLRGACVTVAHAACENRTYPARESWHCHTSHVYCARTVALPHILCVLRGNRGTATHPTCGAGSSGVFAYMSFVMVASRMPAAIASMPTMRHLSRRIFSQRISPNASITRPPASCPSVTQVTAMPTPIVGVASAITNTPAAPYRPPSQVHGAEGRTECSLPRLTMRV